VILFPIVFGPLALPGRDFVHHERILAVTDLPDHDIKSLNTWPMIYVLLTILSGRIRSAAFNTARSRSFDLDTGGTP